MQWRITFNEKVNVSFLISKLQDYPKCSTTYRIFYLICRTNHGGINNNSNGIVCLLPLSIMLVISIFKLKELVWGQVSTLGFCPRTCRQFRHCLLCICSLYFFSNKIKLVSFDLKDENRKKRKKKEHCCLEVNNEKESISFKCLLHYEKVYSKLYMLKRKKLWRL